VTSKQDIWKISVQLAGKYPETSIIYISECMKKFIKLKIELFSSKLAILFASALSAKKHLKIYTSSFGWLR